MLKFKYPAKIILAISLFTAVSGRAYSQISVISKLSRDSILIGDHSVWNNIFSVKSTDSVAIVPYSEILKSDTTGARVEVSADFKLDTISVGDGIKKLNAKVLLTSFDSGSFRLPKPVIIINPGAGADTLEIKAPSLYVNTIQVDTTGFKPKKIKGQATYPVTFSEVMPWVMLVLIILLAIYIVARFIVNRRHNRNFFGKPIVHDPPHIVALRKLEKLRSQKLWQQGKVKQFYTGITDALREYIEARFEKPAKEKTSTEIVEELSSCQIDPNSFAVLKDLLGTSDLVKFARAMPSEEENEDAVKNAVEFVNSTFIQELEEERLAEEKKKENKEV
ncbi:MAG: hypothetical protein LKI53_05365 [Bacteroidales bacterium]|jgi:hypothetical protein|nr:hypothetical protein [Bacteroidales bacterium]